MTNLRTFDPERRSLHDQVDVNWDDVLEIVQWLNVRMDRVLDDRMTEFGPAEVIDAVGDLAWTVRSLHDDLVELIRLGEG